MPEFRDHAFKFHKKGDPDVIFEIAFEDNTNDTVKYFGFISRDTAGAWIIQKMDTSTPVYAYTYVMGTSDFSTAWTNRASLTYVAYNAL